MGMGLLPQRELQWKFEIPILSSDSSSSAEGKVLADVIKLMRLRERSLEPEAEIETEILRPC